MTSTVTTYVCIRNCRLDRFSGSGPLVCRPDEIVEAVLCAGWLDDAAVGRHEPAGPVVRACCGGVNGHTTECAIPNATTILPSHVADTLHALQTAVLAGGDSTGCERLLGITVEPVAPVSVKLVNATGLDGTPVVVDADPTGISVGGNIFVDAAHARLLAADLITAADKIGYSD